MTSDGVQVLNLKADQTNIMGISFFVHCFSLKFYVNDEVDGYTLGIAWSLVDVRHL